MYADWLTEQGDERGELVRLEHRIATEALSLEQRRDLLRQVAAITERGAEGWLGGLPLEMEAQEWRHGFVCRVRAEDPAVIGALLESRAGRFCTAVLLHHQALGDEGVIEIASGQAFARVRRLDLTRSRVGPRGAAALARSRTLRELACLDLSDNPLGLDGLQALARDCALPLRELRLESVGEGLPYGPVLGRATALGQLEALSLGRSDLGDDGLVALCGPGLPSLRELELPDETLSPEGLEALLGSPLAPKLRALDLSYNALGLQGAVALARSPHLAELARLGLQAAELGSQGIEALARAITLRPRRLELYSNEIDAEGAAALASSPLMAQLERLELPSNPIEDEGALALVPHLAGLEVLVLGECELGASAAEALAALPFRRLRELWLESNALGPEGALALAGAAGLRGLTTLSLSGAGLGDEGAVALARSRHLSSLQELYLEENGIGSEGVLALLSSDAMPGLVHLDLGHNLLDDAGLMALRELEPPPRLSWLTLGNNRVKRQALAALEGTRWGPIVRDW